jgi:S-formylglutathione hydrolase
MEILKEHRCFGGVQGFYSHHSETTGTVMRFGVFRPEGKPGAVFPVLTFLAGLTCSEETFAIKAGALRLAAELELILVMPDTSPRGANIEGEENDWDFGVGAGFYLDATRAPWSKNYRMYSYVTGDLQEMIFANFPGDRTRQGIFGHSMGGHGALTIHLRKPEMFRSVSAFAPISAPMQVPWGQKAFTHYLGPDETAWKIYDATELMRALPSTAHILVDQGMADQFLERELKPELLEEAAHASGQRLTLRRHPGYDHSYYFIQSFIADHLWHHASALGGENAL